MQVYLPWTHHISHANLYRNWRLTCMMAIKRLNGPMYDHAAWPAEPMVALIMLFVEFISSSTSVNGATRHLLYEAFDPLGFDPFLRADVVS